MMSLVMIITRTLLRRLIPFLISIERFLLNVPEIKLNKKLIIIHILQRTQKFLVFIKEIFIYLFIRDINDSNLKFTTENIAEF